MPRIQEQKRHVNKPDEFYWCEEIHREEGYLVVSYAVSKAGKILDIEIPAGSLTIAHYRENRHHVLWEMYGPARELIGYLYHICLPPEIGAGHVEYLDLLVDVWFSPDGTMRVLDEDEFEQARGEGKVNEEQAAIVRCELDYLRSSGHATVLQELWRPPESVLAPPR